MSQCPPPTPGTPPPTACSGTAYEGTQGGGSSLTGRTAFEVASFDARSRTGPMESTSTPQRRRDVVSAFNSQPCESLLLNRIREEFLIEVVLARPWGIPKIGRYSEAS